MLAKLIREISAFSNLTFSINSYVYSQLCMYKLVWCCWSRTTFFFYIGLEKRVCWMTYMVFVLQMGCLLITIKDCILVWEWCSWVVGIEMKQWCTIIKSLCHSTQLSQMYYSYTYLPQKLIVNTSDVCFIQFINFQ